MSEPQRWKLSRGSSINGGTGQAEPVTWVTGPRPGRRETIDVVRASTLAEAVEALERILVLTMDGERSDREIVTDVNVAAYAALHMRGQ